MVGLTTDLTTFMAFVSIKAHNLHIKNFRSLRPVWCLINANQKSWEKFHRLSVCVVMLCFTYSRVQLQQNGKIVTIWCNLHCFFFISHRWGNILIEDLLDIYIFVQIIVFRRLIPFDFRHNLLSKIMAFTAYTFFFMIVIRQCRLKSCNWGVCWYFFWC